MPSVSPSTSSNVDPPGPCLGRDLRGPSRHAHRDRVEELGVDDIDAGRSERGRESRRQRVHAPRDGTQAVGAVIRTVETGDHREQHLGGADVARRLLPTDVLLARLQREPERGATLGVDRHADEPARQGAPVLVARCDVRGVRTAEPERYAETL